MKLTDENNIQYKSYRLNRKKHFILSIILRILVFASSLSLSWLIVYKLANYNALISDLPSDWRLIVLFSFLMLLNIFTIDLFATFLMRFFLGLAFFLSFRKTKNKIRKIDVTSVADAKIALLYPTKDDFSSEAVLESINQSYKNIHFFILDDSKKSKYISMIDSFIQQNQHLNITVIRREIKKGFKAGNINNFLSLYKNQFDYYVWLDSDEKLCFDFVERCLQYFYYYSNLGIVQGNHKSDTPQTQFQNLLSRCIPWKLPIINEYYNFIGHSFLYGHGAMISNETLSTMDFKIPEIVIEDIATSIVAKSNKFQTIFASELVNTEEFPVSFNAFRVRQLKFVSGDHDLWFRVFIRKIGRHNNIFSMFQILSNISLSNVLFLVFNLLILIFQIISNVFSVASNIDLNFYFGFKYNIFIILLITGSFIASLIPVFIHIAIVSKRKWLVPFQIIFYPVITFIMYTSLLVDCWIKAFITIFGIKAKFVTTPKTNEKISFGKKILANIIPISTLLIIATLLIVNFVFVHIISLYFIVYLTVTFVIPIIFRVLFSLLSNMKIKIN
ncbi:glycosyltransferase [Mycoplasma zalophidermidis]|uniref:glycosyltransferase n=1 Tax=Mycoplasma zalophidermidis TaxID=398174 RepID=UPI001C10311F|nr:glycosyltransferase family 2 protein [Mycoplasma zalophidermidis]MBU4689948.1 glycosyltransferase family 2 protein [Mycoplasma zalophidermidis]MCR8966767.1 glycosyltransferase family 2 protein [Mycoplasma zalophidermidis]